MDFSADLIDERVWLGSLDSMQNTMALDYLHITHILTLLDQEIEIDIDKNSKIVRKRITVADADTTDLLAEFESCYEFIDRALSSNPENQVLIHCHAGKTSSLCVTFNGSSLAQVCPVVRRSLACG